ncbi:FPR3 protein, partial [Polyodon spathula]|nr:N-formyl peptide receptor 3-like [Polyodon spathula]MBN3282884.1 FPR3 protein [Polyodon spathula]
MTVTGEPLKQDIGNPEEVLRYLNLFLCSLIFIIGITWNGIVIWLTGFRVKKTEFNMWFLNLAVADFLFILCLPLRMVSLFLRRWSFGVALCKGYYFLSTVNMYTSAFILMAVSIDRCIAMVYPLWHRNHRPKQLAQKVSQCLWVLTFAMSLPLAFYSKLKETKKNVSNCFVDIYVATNVSDVQNSTSREGQQMLANVLAVFLPIFICGFLIPLGVITSSYSVIAYRMKTERLRFSNLYRLLVAAVFSFFITWAPSRILGIVQVIAIYSQRKEVFQHLQPYLPLASSIGYINSCINPVLYVLLRKEFKDKLWALKESMLRRLQGTKDSSNVTSTGRELSLCHTCPPSNHLFTASLQGNNTVNTGLYINSNNQA